MPLVDKSRGKVSGLGQRVHHFLSASAIYHSTNAVEKGGEGEGKVEIFLDHFPSASSRGYFLNFHVLQGKVMKGIFFSEKRASIQKKSRVIFSAKAYSFFLFLFF